MIHGSTDRRSPRQNSRPDRPVSTSAPMNASMNQPLMMATLIRCMVSTKVRSSASMDLGVRTWGNSAAGATVMLAGTYQQYSEISGKLLAALPPLLVLPEDAWDCPIIPLLADEIGVSRATLARRFTDLVGEPPMAFLTSWRLALAADLLREPDSTVGSVAQRVGYGSPFALSTAFKRVRGISPQQHRGEALRP